MAKIYDFTKPCKITITNVMDPNDPALVNKDSLTGERRIISLAEAKAAGFTDFEYVLDNDGNFVIDPESGASVGTPVVSDDIMVVVRQSVKSTDRYIQFFGTQQKILLASGESITFEATGAGAVAHYMALAVPGEIEVTAIGAETKEAVTEADITAALADTEITNIQLASDITLANTLTVSAAGKTINGDGHTVTATVTPGSSSGSANKDAVLISASGVTISNMNIVATGLTDNTQWSSNYGLQVFNTDATISDVKVSGANGGMIINGSTVTMTGTIDVSGNGFGGIEVSKGANTAVPALDATKATFVNTNEAYGKPTIWIDGYSEIGDVVKAPANMTKLVYTEDGKDQLHFYINAANAVKPTE